MFCCPSRYSPLHYLVLTCHKTPINTIIVLKIKYLVLTYSFDDWKVKAQFAIILLISWDETLQDSAKRNIYVRIVG